MATARELRWKEIPKYGLEKVPVEALYRMARIEVGQLQSYIQELEDEIQSLKAENANLLNLIGMDEERRLLKLAIIEAKKEAFVQELIKGKVTRDRHMMELEMENYRLLSKITELKNQPEQQQ